MHYYASHPQSYYGKGHMNPDTVGLARELLQKEEGVPQIYFTGCAGNIAYNLKMLGGEPVVMATIGDDGAPYAERLASLGIASEILGAFAARNRIPAADCPVFFGTTSVNVCLRSSCFL